MLINYTIIFNFIYVILRFDILSTHLHMTALKQEHNNIGPDEYPGFSDLK